MVSSGRAGDKRSDAVLLREANRDAAAFAELYGRHVEAVYGWLRRRIEWAASDLTAETFARAWLNRGRFRDQRDGSALPWLLGIAANLLADAVRRDRIETRAREKLGSDPPPLACGCRARCGDWPWPFQRRNREREPATQPRAVRDRARTGDRPRACSPPPTCIASRALAHTSRPRVLASTTVGAAALATVLALVLGATTSAPAFAVTRNPDGTVTVKLLRLSGIAGANQRLAIMGVRARIISAREMAAYVARAHPCQGQALGTVQTIIFSGTVGTVTFKPALIPSNDQLLVAPDRAAHLRYYSIAAKLRARALAAGLSHPTGAANSGNPGSASTTATGTNHVTVYCARAYSWPRAGHS